MSHETYDSVPNRVDQEPSTYDVVPKRNDGSTGTVEETSYYNTTTIEEDCKIATDKDMSYFKTAEEKSYYNVIKQGTETGVYAYVSIYPLI